MSLAVLALAGAVPAQDKAPAPVTGQKGEIASESRPAPADNTVRWNELTVGASKLRFYGMLRLDVYHDDSRPNNTQTIAYIRSEDPAAPPSIGNRPNEEDLTIHPRLTRFGLDLDGPVVDALGDAKVTGKLEFDFYNNGLVGQTESREAVRMRHAYGKLTWGDTSFLAGQTNDVISPIFPIVNNDLVMWGAGNLGDRRPQLRVEHQPGLGSGKMILQGEAGLTGANDNQDLDPTGSSGATFRDGEQSGLPTLQGRVAYRCPLFDKQNLEVGLWGHLAWEQTDAAFNGNRKFESDAVGVDVTLPLYKDRLWIKGEVWQGKNLDDVRGGILQGVNTTTGREISARGGWIELGGKVVERVALYAGYSTDNPENSDLNAGGRAANKIWYGAARLNFDPIEFGLEYLNWTTDYVGFGDGDDNRIGFYMAYKF